MPREAHEDGQLLGGHDSASRGPDATNLVKRLNDNQPLSDTDERRDDDMGERRQYGVRSVNPEPGAEEG